MIPAESLARIMVTVGSIGATTTTKDKSIVMGGFHGVTTCNALESIQLHLSSFAFLNEILKFPKQGNSFGNTNIP